MSRIKVCYVHGNSDIIAGQEKVLLNIVKKIGDYNVEPCVVLPGNGIFAEVLKAAGIPVSFVPQNRFFKKNPYPFFSTLFKFFTYVKKEKINVIHTSGLYPNQYSSIAAKFAGIPCICHLHSSIYSRNEMCNSLLNNSDLAITVSEGIRENVVKVFKIPGKVRTVYNGLYPENYRLDAGSAARVRKSFNIAGGDFIVGQVGQVIERKGIEYFIRMAQVVSAVVPNTVFMLVGDDKYEPGYMKKMKGLAEELKLSDKIIFTGFRDDITDLISSMDIVVLNSLVEGLPTVLLEAMMLGKPVVATRITGTDEIIKDGVNGLLVTPKDYNAMAGRVTELLNNMPAALAMAATARRSAEECFTLESQLKKLSKIYAILTLNRRHVYAAG